jgi:hypothetical protein
VFTERSAEACCEALCSGGREESRRFGSLSVGLFPACCLLQALPGKELSDVDRQTHVSFRWACGKLCVGEWLVNSMLPTGGECEGKRMEAGGAREGVVWKATRRGGSGGGGDIIPTLARELFASGPTRLEALGRVGEEHLH